jgi:mycofactocin precursor
MSAQAKSSTAENTAQPLQATKSSSESPVEADTLIEEVSIDGMCGVY